MHMHFRMEATVMDISLNAPALFDLSGRVALVTGAGSGIGQRIALGLAQSGARVSCLDRRTDRGLADTVQMIEAAGPAGNRNHCRRNGPVGPG